MKTILAAALLLVPTLAEAQTADPAPATTPRTGGLLGQMSGLLGGGGALPQIGAIGAGNAAGLLGYCVKNRLLGAGGNATGAAGVLGRLAGQREVREQPGYAAGRSGQVQTPGGQALSLDSLRGQVKNQLCTLVLNRAKSFL